MVTASRLTANESSIPVFDNQHSGIHLQCTTCHISCSTSDHAWFAQVGLPVQVVVSSLRVIAKCHCTGEGELLHHTDKGESLSKFGSCDDTIAAF